MTKYAVVLMLAIGGCGAAPEGVEEEGTVQATAGTLGLCEVANGVLTGQCVGTYDRQINGCFGHTSTDCVVGTPASGQIKAKYCNANVSTTGCN